MCPVQDALPSSPERTAVDASEFQWDGHSTEPGIGIAVSGGGFRAMLFHAGAFARLNELGLLIKSKADLQRFRRLDRRRLPRQRLEPARCAGCEGCVCRFQDALCRCLSSHSPAAISTWWTH